VKKADRSGRPENTGPLQNPGNEPGAASSAGQSLAAHEVVPTSDPLYPILTGILDVVSTSRWTFARVGPSGDLISLYGSHSNGGEMARLTDEFKRQRTKSPRGPRISATLGPIDEFESGITLLFSDVRSNFGILTLLRTAALGPFTSTEISLLTLALDAVSDRLSGLRLQPGPEQAAPSGRSQVAPEEETEGAFYVLDRDLQIVLAWNSGDQRRIALTGLHTRVAERLPAVLEETVRALTAAWSDDSEKSLGVAHPVPFLVVRTQPLTGPSGLFIGVRIDRFQPPKSLGGAATRYHISPREVQVLALLLDGNHLDQIATQLHITSSTVQDHINSMLEKTGAKNRSELIARVLGWESTPGSTQP
jgi:DNA-binding CsgD family transcriptional regulator